MPHRLRAAVRAAPSPASNGGSTAPGGRRPPPSPSSTTCRHRATWPRPLPGAAGTPATNLRHRRDYVAMLHQSSPCTAADVASPRTTPPAPARTWSRPGRMPSRWPSRSTPSPPSAARPRRTAYQDELARTARALPVLRPRRPLLRYRRTPPTWGRAAEHRHGASTERRRDATTQPPCDARRRRSRLSARPPSGLRPGGYDQNPPIYSSAHRPRWTRSSPRAHLTSRPQRELPARPERAACRGRHPGRAPRKTPGSPPCVFTGRPDHADLP